MSDNDRAALLVDLGGVLFHFDHQHRLRTLGALLSLAPDDVHDMFWASGFSRDCDRGLLPEADHVEQELRRLSGYRGSSTDLRRAWCSAYRPNTTVIPLLDRPPGTEPELGLLSDNGPLEEDVLTAMHPGAFGSFRHLLFSHRLGATKHDPELFARVETLLHRGPNQITLVDDNPDHCAAARTAGWRSRRYTQPGDLSL